MFIFISICFSCTQKEDCSNDGKLLEYTIDYIDHHQSFEYAITMAEWPINDSGEFIAADYAEKLKNINHIRNEAIKSIYQKREDSLHDFFRIMADRMGSHISEYHKEKYFQYANEVINDCALHREIAIYLVYGKAWESILNDIDM
ncbi:MAG: hypothetical protein JJU02_04770 [Cryomorphaceae bacterium]|nr:hypothetical protein [Cryomorphaceae bacterium]